MTRPGSPQFIALVLASTLAVFAAGYAAAHNPDPGAPGSHSSRFQERLGLTDDQMSAIREIYARHAEERKQLWQSLRKAQADQRQLTLNGGDPAAIKAKTAEIASLLSQMTEMRATTLQEISPILTPEQRAELAQMSPRDFWRHRSRPAEGS